MKNLLNKLKPLGSRLMKILTKIGKFLDFRSKDVKVGVLGEDGTYTVTKHGGEEPDKEK